ncbi:hypothetical protein O7606_16630 [Micromonospora sp. WMMD882]|uniref:hypothetical protein n=1 Tax=Micromonospora sp. WMMD882 TaxID=3015151 RepID=UPI00248BC22D|nr:hypothetical protein [Micromonospora sp. WMMD882]WBB77889.1 hypothetical protein O7606_16630 [Micromonospora sp. WMMD882]
MTERNAVLRRILAVVALAAVPLLFTPNAIPAYANAAPQEVVVNGNGAPATLSLDGTWACSVPSGYTWDIVEPTGACGSLNYRYRLRTPVTGLWACHIPFGWSYDSLRSTSACGTTGPYQYRLVG